MTERVILRTPVDPDGAPPGGGGSGTLQVLRRLGLTTGYVLVLVVTACWLSGQTKAERARFIRHNSSNVHHIGVGKWWTLFTSGLVVDGVPAWVGITAIAAVVGLAEWRWGAARTAAVFLFGHLGATLLTEGAMWVMVVTHVPGALSRARDVGISYGLVATGSCLLALGPRPWRRYGLTALAVALCLAWALDEQLADAGHVIALALGVLAARSHWISRSPRIAAA